MPTKKKQAEKKKKPSTAFTLIEVMIVVAIVALLMVTLFVSVKNNRVRAQDAAIKADLENLRIAFENYYNDKNCYPPVDWFDSADDCGANYLAPYLSSIPCSPKTELPYQLEYTAGQCDGFRLYASLSNTNDSAVTDLCVETGGSTLGNYGVSSTNATVGINCAAIASAAPTGTPLASPQFTPGPYACQGNVCNNFGTGNSCLVSFTDQTECESYCASPGSVSCN